jgi:sugar lactone lactonase YvrE
LHQQAFSLPWQVAFVYDPVIGEYGFFRWHGVELVPARFYLASGTETYREPSLSQWVGQRLRVLSGYLERLQINIPILKESKRLYAKLERLTSGSGFVTSLVEDTLSTLVTVSEMEPKALNYAKTFVEGFIGQRLLLGQNVNSVSSNIFESPAIAISQGNVYFVQGTNLLRASLDQEHKVSFIPMSAQVDHIAVNNDSLFALDSHGIVYVIPFSEFERVASGLSSDSTRTQVSIEVETVALTPQPGELFQAVSAHGNSLYLITPRTAWAMDLRGSGTLRPKVFELSTVKGQFPVNARALAVDAQGNMYVADTANSRVLQIRPNSKIEYQFRGDGRVPLVTPASLCVKGQELYVLDSSLRRIIVYDLKNLAYLRQYNWGEFIGDKTIQRLFTDQANQVYFSAGHDTQRLYRIDKF